MRAKTKTARLAEERLTQLLWRGEMEDDAGAARRALEATPEAWATIEMDLPCAEPKEKVTLYLDRSVARTFRAMGTGWHARVNRVLATWVQHRAASVGEDLRSVRAAMRQSLDPDPEDMKTTDWLAGFEAGQKAFRAWAVQEGVIPGE